MTKRRPPVYRGYSPEIDDENHTRVVLALRLAHEDFDEPLTATALSAWRRDLAAFLALDGRPRLGATRVQIIQAPLPATVTVADLRELQRDARALLAQTILTRAVKPDHPVGATVNVSLRTAERLMRDKPGALYREITTTTRHAFALLLGDALIAAPESVRRCADPKCGRVFAGKGKAAYHVDRCQRRHYMWLERHPDEDAPDSTPPERLDWDGLE